MSGTQIKPLVISAVVIVVSALTINWYADASYEPRRNLDTPKAETLLPLSCAIVIPEAMREGVGSFPKMKATGEDLILLRPVGELLAAALEDSARKVFRDVRVVPAVGAIDGKADVIIEVNDIKVPENHNTWWKVREDSLTLGMLGGVETGMSVNLKVHITRDGMRPELFDATANTACSHGTTLLPLRALGRLMTRQAEESVREISKRVLNKAIPEGQQRQVPDIASVVIELAKSEDVIDAGRGLYSDYCAGCHGRNAEGTPDNPNLIDDDWLFGELSGKGNTPALLKSIIVEGRKDNICPEFGKTASPNEIDQLAEYVLNMSSREAGGVEAMQGRALFIAKGCIICHGYEGEGMPILGAPNLTDNIWLHSKELDSIKAALRNGRNGSMPGFRCQLTDQEANQLTAYVYSLNN